MVVMTYPHGFHRVRATLTATSNPYLADQLPLYGEITVHETNTDGRPMASKVTFRAADDSKIGGLAAPVEVRNAVWSVTQQNMPEDDSTMITRTALEAVLDKAHLPPDRVVVSGEPFAIKNNINLDGHWFGVYLGVGSAVMYGVRLTEAIYICRTDARAMITNAQDWNVVDERGGIGVLLVFPGYQLTD